MTRKQPRPFYNSFFAFFAGALNVFAFSPFNWWWLCLISVGVLFWLWLHVERGSAARLGYLYGIGLFGVGTSWTFVSLHTFGGMSPLLAGFCIVLLVLGVSLFIAGAGYAQGFFSRYSTTVRVMLIMPSTWLLVEWLRGWVLSGFPWLTSGYAMIDTPIANFAPLGGVHLVSLLTLMSTGALLKIILGASRKDLLLIGLLGACWGNGWYGLNPQWSEPQGKEISVAIVQNNIALSTKWDPVYVEGIIEDYLTSSPQEGVDLVIWPEGAIPDFLDRLPADFFERLRAHPADFIFGVLSRARTDGTEHYFNSAAAFSVGILLYNKQHLVPFGEYMPLGWLFARLLASLDIPVSDLSPWQQPQSPLYAADTFFATSICYEDAFPEEWRNQVPEAGVLVNLNEDSWFGNSLAPHQRLQMARFRSLESERGMLRASNNGLSSIIDWRGEITQVAPQFTRAVVTATVQPRTGITPYIRYGDTPALLLALALWLVGIRIKRKN